MKRLLTVLVVATALILLIAPLALAQDGELKEVLDQVRGLYGQAAGFRAEYVKRERIGVLAQPGVSAEVAESSGEMVFSRPDSLRIMEAKPTRAERAAFRKMLEEKEKR